MVLATLTVLLMAFSVCTLLKKKLLKAFLNHEWQAVHTLNALNMTASVARIITKY